MNQVRIVINGAGAAGVAIARLLAKLGQKTFGCATPKAFSTQRSDLSEEKQEFAVTQMGF